MTPTRSLYRWALLLFFFSGLTGLVYEILWTRRLSLTFGHSLLAVSTVVTAYMGGLAAGSWLGGRWADRQEGRPAAFFLRTYARLEFGIGLWGLLSLPLLGLVERVYFGLASSGWAGLPLQLAVFVLSVLVLLPPTTAMGATLPILSCLFGAPEELGVKLSRLYSSNTWGAMGGAALAGFLWLPTLGLRFAVVLAALANLAIGLTGSLLARGPLPDPVKVPVAEQSATRPDWRLPAVFALSGLASMLFQLGWTRGLSLYLGSSVYAFSAILTVFLGGIAGGSGLYGRLLRGREPQLSTLAAVYALLGLSGAASLLMLGWLPRAFVAAFPYVQSNFAALLGLEVLLSAVILLLPTLCMGLLFPLVTHLYHRGAGGIGGSVGTIYGANTLGCIVGSFVGGFFLVPQLGVQPTVQIAAACCLLAGLTLWLSRRTLPLWLLGIAACWSLPAWDTGIASAGIAISVAREGARTAEYYPPPAFYRDGISCTVALAVTGPGQLSLRVNGKADASLQLDDRLTQTSLGVIPLFYQAKPARVAVIGLGSGLTVTAVADAPGVEVVDCAELEPAVIDCQDYWAPFNGHVLQNPKVRTHVADGRTFILSSRERYDVIISEPSNPWIAGIGNLYTLDFYRSCRERLQPGGCFVQWCNLYALAPEDLDLVVRTFYQAFPHGDLWTTGGDLVLIGAAQPTRCSPANLRRTPYLHTELAELGFYRPQELAGQYLCTREEALRHVPAGPLNTDDLPRLEYSAPRSLYRPEALYTNLQRCVSWRGEGIPPGWPESDREAAWWGQLNFAAPELVKPAPGAFFQSLAGATSAQPIPTATLRRQWPLRARLELARRASRIDADALVLELLSGCPPEYYVLQLRANAQYRLAQWANALASYKALQQFKQHSEIWSSLASCEFFLGHWAEAQQATSEALRLNPYDPRAMYIEAELLSRSQRAPEATRRLREVTRICPYMISGWTLLARVEAAQGHRGDAERSLRQGNRIAPGHPGIKATADQLGVRL